MFIACGALFQKNAELMVFYKNIFLHVIPHSSMIEKTFKKVNSQQKHAISIIRCKDAREQFRERKMLKSF